MSINPGPNVIFVYTGIRLPAQFATDNGVNKEITVERVSPGPSQTWFIQPTGESDVYTITAGAFPPHPDSPGFRREIENGPRDVLNARLPGKWRIVPIERPAGVVAFRIHPVSPIIGVEELLGTDGDKVVIQIFPIGSPDEGKPAWSFNAVN